MDRIKEILKKFNFSEDEIAIYLSVLSFGKANVAQIAKKTGKNRTAIYFHINKMIEKHIIEETRKGKKFVVTAVPPTGLADILDRSLVDFKSLIPQLESLKKATDETPIIEITESKAGYLKVLDEIASLPEGDMFRVIEGQDGMLNEISLISDEKLQVFFKKLIERKIIARAVYPENALHIPRKDLSREAFALLSKRIQETKVLPDNIFPVKNLALAYRDKISFLFPDTALVLTIKDKKVADFFKVMFDGLFYTAKHAEKTW